MAQGKAKVVILDHTGGKKAHVILPTNVSVKKLLPGLTQALKMQMEGEGGQPIRYDLALETGEEAVKLTEDETLAEAAVEDGALLRITPEMQAGTEEG